MTEKGVMDKSLKELTRDGFKIILGIGVITTGVGVLYCVGKVNSIDRLVDGSIKDLSKRTPVNVSDSLIRAATERAVEKAVASASSSVSSDVRDDMNRQIRIAVADSVKNMYSTIKDQVSKEVANKVARLDISDLREQVKDMAKDEIIDRMNLDMDDVLADYNRQLESVGKIYSSIAETFSKKAGS